MSEEWSVSPFQHSLDVDWENEGDEWSNHLYEVLNARVRLSNWRFPPDPETGGFLLTATRMDNRKQLPRVRVTPEEDGVGVRIISDGEPDESDVELWTDVIRQATAMTGRSHREFEWTAAVGIAGIVMAAKELTTASRVGPLFLEPFGRAVAEHWDQPSLARVGTSFSFPVKVKGTAVGYKWEVAAQAASRDLHRLACLLSIAWEEPWTLRERPRNDDSITLPIATEWVPPNGIPLDVPAWLDGAWTMLDKDEALMHATHAYHQGALIEARHPSLALVAFVAAVEGIGARYVPLKRCSDCGASTGSRQRFVVAASQVIPEEDARKLVKNVYDAARSKTAHEGRLHGLEESFGAFVFPGIFTGDSKSTFDLVAVHGVKGVAVKLLQRGLQGDLP